MDVRSVSGWGPYCGCGRPSALHVIDSPLDAFLCTNCTLAAVRGYLAATKQPEFQGDRHRDAPPEALSAPASFTAMGNQDGLGAAWVTYEDGTTRSAPQPEEEK